MECMKVKIYRVRDERGSPTSSLCTEQGEQQTLYPPYFPAKLVSIMTVPPAVVQTVHDPNATCPPLLLVLCLSSPSFSSVRSCIPFSMLCRTTMLGSADFVSFIGLNFSRAIESWDLGQHGCLKCPCWQLITITEARAGLYPCTHVELS